MAEKTVIIECLRKRKNITNFAHLFPRYRRLIKKPSQICIKMTKHDVCELQMMRSTIEVAHFRQFSFWITGFLCHKTVGMPILFRKMSFLKLGPWEYSSGSNLIFGHGSIHREAVWFLLESFFGWRMEPLKGGASENLGRTSIVERVRFWFGLPYFYSPDPKK